MSVMPKPFLILAYKDFFHVDPPTDRLSIISLHCKRNLIAEFAALNYKLKSRTDIHAVFWQVQGSASCYNDIILQVANFRN